MTKISREIGYRSFYEVTILIEFNDCEIDFHERILHDGTGVKHLWMTKPWRRSRPPKKSTRIIRR